MWYTRKFGNFRSSGNQKKEGCICLRPVLRTPACPLAIVTSYRLLGSVKKKQRVRTDTKGRFTDRHRKEIGTHHVNACSCILQVLGSFIQEREHEGALRSIHILTTIVTLVHCGWRWWRLDVWCHKTYVIKFRFSYFRAAAAAAAAAYYRLGILSVSLSTLGRHSKTSGFDVAEGRI
jgi:hypothetical protein